MSKEDAEAGGQQEVALWEKYTIVKPRFTNTKKALCRESVANEGMDFYWRHYHLWQEFSELDKTDVRRVKFHERIWEQTDQEMQLSAKVMSRKRKRDVVSDSGSSESMPPRIPSPDTVVLPNEEGFDEYLKRMNKKYALNDNGWD
eukprot:scaffold14615_cov65-Cyclotella_meneghiniana.AAC.16